MFFNRSYISNLYIRLWYPIDYWVGFLGFIQTEFARVPQYVSFFILGILASQRNWLLTFDKKTGFIWLSVGVGIVTILYVSGNALEPYFLKGGANVGSLARSFIEALLSISLIIGLLVLFREKVNIFNRLSLALARNVYVVYFIHVPVVVFLQYTLANLPITVLTKFVFTAFFGVVLSFLISHYVWRKIPYLKNLM